MDNAIYDMALTVRITAGKDWSTYKVVQGDNISYATVKVVDGARVIDAEIVPDRGEAIVIPLY